MALPQSAFPIDMVWIPEAIVDLIRSVTVGASDNFVAGTHHSDHVPVTVALDLTAMNLVKGG